MITVLVAEDDAASRAYIQDAVESLGFQCEVTCDGIEVVEAFRKSKPNIVLLDIQMPRKNGLEALYEIRQADANVIIIMMTAYGNEESAVQAFRIGANDYLNKPIRTKDLRALLKKYEAAVVTQKQKQKIFSFVKSRKLILEIPTDYELMLPISNLLAEEVATALAKPYDMGTRLGFYELLLNAFEHGSLGIGYHKKREYIESDNLRFQELIQERLKDPALSEKMIYVEFNATPEEVSVTVTDEGNGFDYGSIKSELNSPDVFRGSGRGIIICKCQFDSVEFLGKGNSVKIVKKAVSAPRELPEFMKL